MPSARTALVTGASRGIGRAVALRLAAASVDVLALARDRDALRAVAATASPGKLTPLPCDLTDSAALREALAHCASASIIVNNAGWATARTPVSAARLDDWQRTLAVCLQAPMTIVHALLPGILAAGQGTIVNVLSPAARVGRAGEAAYAAAKAGLRAFGESLRDELRETDVKVAAIYPGYVDTDFLPPNRRLDRSRLLRPDDVAAAVMLCVDSPPHVCPAEIVLEPQRNPLSSQPDRKR